MEEAANSAASIFPARYADLFMAVPLRPGIVLLKQDDRIAFVGLVWVADVTGLYRLHRITRQTLHQPSLHPSTRKHLPEAFEHQLQPSGL